MNGCILALDVGTRRIGVAVADETSRFARPLFTLHRTSLRADLKALARVVRKHEVAELVVGDPVNADGTPGTQAAKVREFAATLFEEHPGLQHHLLDERLTTRDAHALLGPRRKTADRVERKHLIDQVAATLLLEAFLAHRHGPVLLPDPDAAAALDTPHADPEGLFPSEETSRELP